MPAPTNISAATATDLGTITSTAATVTQNVHDSGTTYTVWYTFTAPTGVDVVNIFARNQDFTGTYDPYIIVYTGPDAGSLSAHLGIENDRAPVQIPVTAGTGYWLEITFSAPGHPSPAVLAITSRAFTQQSIPAGAILIPDDAVGFPGAVVNPSTGQVVRFLPSFPAGESAYVLDDGYLLTEDLTGTDTVKLYSPSLTQVASLDWRPSGVNAGFISGRGDLFYVANPTSATTGSMPANSVRTITKEGAFGGTTWTPTGFSGSEIAIAVSPDHSVLYWHTSSPATPTLKRWDLVSDVALSDLATGPGGYNQRRQILVLDDGSILATYVSSPNVVVRRYDPDSGAVLNTYNFTSVLADIGDNQIALATDDPASFWVFLKPTQGFSQFKRIRVSDGSVLSASPQVPQYEVGAYRPTPSETPSAWWGHSESCPFIVLRAAIVQDPTIDPSFPEACCCDGAFHSCCSHGRTLSAGATGLSDANEGTWSTIAPDSSEGRLFPSTADPTIPETWS